MFPCCLCQKKVHYGLTSLCRECERLFSQPQLRSLLGVSSLFPYDEALRTLVLQVKIKKNPRCLSFLTSLMGQNEEVLERARGMDLIVPAPSSFFSRFYGRYDLAWFLARKLSEEVGVPMKTPPLSFYFSFSKRSRRKRGKERYPLGHHFRSQEGKLKLLLIDDVLTTGFTLRKLCQHYGDHYSLQAMTLAYARRLS